MTVVEFETWRHWYMTKTVGSDKVSAWFDLPIKERKEILSTISMYEWEEANDRS